jgi:hypothetical protein
MEEQLPSPECYQPADIFQPDSELDPLEEDMLEKDGATLLDVDNEGEVATEHGGEYFEQEEFPGSPDRVDDIRLKVDKTRWIVTTANQGAEYQHRGNDLTEVNVWDFVARVEKIKEHVANHAMSSRKILHTMMIQVMTLTTMNQKLKPGATRMRTEISCNGVGEHGRRSN